MLYVHLDGEMVFLRLFVSPLGVVPILALLAFVAILSLVSFPTRAHSLLPPRQCWSGLIMMQRTGVRTTVASRPSKVAVTPRIRSCMVEAGMP